MFGQQRQLISIWREERQLRQELEKIIAGLEARGLSDDEVWMEIGAETHLTHPAHRAMLPGMAGQEVGMVMGRDRRPRGLGRPEPCDASQSALHLSCTGSRRRFLQDHRRS
jgi:hypothetical protein